MHGTRQGVENREQGTTNSGGTSLRAGARGRIWLRRPAREVDGTKAPNRDGRKTSGRLNGEMLNRIYAVRRRPIAASRTAPENSVR